MSFRKAAPRRPSKPRAGGSEVRGLPPLGPWPPHQVCGTGQTHSGLYSSSRMVPGARFRTLHSGRFLSPSKPGFLNWLSSFFQPVSGPQSGSIRFVSYRGQRVPTCAARFLPSRSCAQEVCSGCDESRVYLAMSTLHIVLHVSSRFLSNLVFRRISLSGEIEDLGKAGF